MADEVAFHPRQKGWNKSQEKKDRNERGTHLYMEFIGNTADGRNPEITTWNAKKPLNNGIYYQPQLDSRIFSINSIVACFYIFEGYLGM